MRNHLYKGDVFGPLLLCLYIKTPLQCPLTTYSMFHIQVTKPSRKRTKEGSACNFFTLMFRFCLSLPPKTKINAWCEKALNLTKRPFQSVNQVYFCCLKDEAHLTMDLLSTEVNGKDWCITCNIKYVCNNNVLNVKKQHCYIDKFGARCLFVP